MYITSYTIRTNSKTLYLNIYIHHLTQSHNQIHPVQKEKLPALFTHLQMPTTQGCVRDPQEVPDSAGPPGPLLFYYGVR